MLDIGQLRAIDLSHHIHRPEPKFVELIGLSTGIDSDFDHPALPKVLGELNDIIDALAVAPLKLRRMRPRHPRFALTRLQAIAPELL